MTATEILEIRHYLEGKVAIVTGGTRDIGHSCSIKLAEASAKVVVNYHSSKAAGEGLGQIASDYDVLLSDIYGVWCMMGRRGLQVRD